MPFVGAPVYAGHREGSSLGTWFWLNIPLALLFVCCWAGIPLWLTLTRWNAELRARHAEVATTTASRPVPEAAHETASPAYAGVASR